MSRRHALYPVHREFMAALRARLDLDRLYRLRLAAFAVDLRLAGCPVAGTPRDRRRLRRLADAVAYAGPLLDERPEAEREQDEAEALP